MLEINDDNTKIEEAEKFYDSLLNFTEIAFSDITAKGILDINSIAEKIKELLNIIRHNQRYLLYVLTRAKLVRIENYVTAHTARTAIVVLVIGTYLRLPNHHLLNLGIAALFHDIGMLKLPPETYLKKSNLTEEEKKLIYTHPIHGYKLLKTANFPNNIITAVLQHHEREDGSGYPQQLTGDNINIDAKIIAVACSYEAISSKRLYKLEKNHHAGIIELLANKGNKYNKAIINALIYSFSIYPIGLQVLLSNGKTGQVVDIDSIDPRYPVVQVIEPNGKDDKTIIMTSKYDISIIRPIIFDEMTK